jgi:hypothetical protein
VECLIHPDQPVVQVHVRPTPAERFTRRRPSDTPRRTGHRAGPH